MDSKEKTKKHFDAIASDYNQSSDGKFVQRMYEPILAELKTLPGGKLLDVGCGNGNLFGFLGKCAYELYGIDFSEKMIAEAKEKYSDCAKFFTADAKALPFENNMFDILVCNASFHHYTEPTEVLDEMNRVAKPGAVLLIGDPHMPAFIRGIANALTKFSNEGDFHYYGAKEMEKLLEAHGFKMTKAYRTGKHTMLYIAKKS